MKISRPIRRAEYDFHALCRRVADNVRRFRNLKGLSQWQLSERADISLPLVRRVELARGNIRMQSLYSIARGLSVDISDLLTTEHEKVGLATLVVFADIKDNTPRRIVSDRIADNLKTLDCIESVLVFDTVPHQ